MSIPKKEKRKALQQKPLIEALSLMRSPFKEETLRKVIRGLRSPQADGINNAA
jgi:hypothetical protein